MANKLTPPGTIINIGTHCLHMISGGAECSLPTIVFEHGAGGSALMWSLVYPEIAKLTRVVVYDRAGYGWSEAGPLPRTNEKCVEELHELLVQARIDGPIILVGHSYGGINARLYANRYPNQVRGMVLVDATHEDELTDRFPREHHKGQEMGAKMMRVFTFLSKIGILRALAACKMVPGFSKAIGGCPPEVQKMLWKKSFQTSALTAAGSEFAHLRLGYELVRKAPDLGELPLTVIAAGIVDQFAPGTSKEVQGKIKQALRDAASDTSDLSKNGKLVVAENSSHNVHLEQPDIVINAIKEMVTANTF
ncbi:alpha/beta hydrolase [Neobacillus novalis]|uniref:Alpha/beta hydrolase n=1 Tax=Neobacillus novalis TaxID=220687 RepID=A0AA95SDM2_9BACI|nr:alpha/beta hydrolase [Neobacillus novalis]WHY87268.1 alpha/beta hydrolase [Neobacillus novalis]